MLSKSATALCVNLISNWQKIKRKLKKKMTINNYPPYVCFGDIQPLSRSLWILYRQHEDLQENPNPQISVEERLRDEICFVTFDLYNECMKWNISLAQFTFLSSQIREKNQTVNPIPFDWDRHAYINHISNCFFILD